MGKTLEAVRQSLFLYLSSPSLIKHIKKEEPTSAHECAHGTNIHPEKQSPYRATQHHKYPIDDGSTSHYQPCTGDSSNTNMIVLQRQLFLQP